MLLVSSYHTLTRVLISSKDGFVSEDIRPVHGVDQKLLDHAGVMLVGIDAAEQVVLISHAGCTLLGRERADILDKNWFDHFIPAHAREAARHVFRAIVHGTEEPARYVESPVLARDGAEHAMLWHNILLRTGSGDVIGVLAVGEQLVASGSPIERLARSERELAAMRHNLQIETKLRESAEEELDQSLTHLQDYRYALDQACIVAMTDSQGTIIHANDQFCRISKYTRAELIGRNHRIVNSGYHSAEFFREMWATIGSGRVWRADIKNRAKDGASYWVDTTIVPFVDERGKPYQYLAIRHDITQRKKQEEQLRNQAALTQLGAMAAVVAHEVKNPLAGIAGAIQIIGKKLPEGSRERAIVGDMLERISALNETIRDILGFARPQPPRTQSVKVLDLVNNTVSLFLKDPKLSGLNVRVEGDGALVSADPALLEQDLLNILINAAQAMSYEGTIRVSIGADSEQCALTIHDSGPGIPADIRAQVFEPFFTTTSALAR